MPITPFSDLTDLAAALQSGVVGARELAELYLERVRTANSKLNAFVRIDETLALHHARAADERRVPPWGRTSCRTYPAQLRKRTGSSLDWLKRPVRPRS